MDCFSYDIPGMRVPLLVCLCFSLGYSSTPVTGACPVTTDLIMRANVITTKTTAAVERMCITSLHTIQSIGHNKQPGLLGLGVLRKQVVMVSL